MLTARWVGDATPHRAGGGRAGVNCAG